jgi:hypothetical protein
MTKFGKSRKIGLSGFLFRTTGFGSFRVKPMKELNSKI